MKILNSIRPLSFVIFLSYIVIQISKICTILIVGDKLSRVLTARKYSVNVIKTDTNNTVYWQTPYLNFELLSPDFKTPQPCEPLNIVCVSYPS